MGQPVYRKKEKGKKSGDAGEEAQQPRSRRAGEAEVEMIKALYANSPDLLALTNRRIVYLGIDGLAVIFDDDQRVTGYAVVKDQGVNRAAFVERQQDGRFLENGQTVDMKGWIHSTIWVYETAMKSWPAPDEVIAM